MPRDVNGNYTLPTGNPVVTLTTISSSWANTTLTDISTALTNSLDRSGASSGMTGQFKAADGTLGAPGIAFQAETTSGFYRHGANDVRMAVNGLDVLRFSAQIFLPQAPIEALDGAVGAPSYSFVNEATSGLYRHGAGDIRLAIGGVDELLFSAAGLTSIPAVTAPAFIPNGATVPVNGMYLSAANTLAFATNTALRASINSTGNWSLAAATAGVTMTISGLAGQSVLSLQDNTGPTGVGVGLFISRPNGSTFNAVGEGPSLQLNDALNTTATILQHAGGQTELWQNDGAAWTEIAKFLSSSSAGGKQLQILDDAGNFQSVGWRDMPPTGNAGNYTLVLADRGKSLFQNSASTTTVTIPANASVAFPLGTVILIINNPFATGSTQVAITTDTLSVYGLGSGTRTIAPGGMMTIVKTSATSWVGSGTGIS